jgi:parvulin-like peptidyl-prolyl isomerase
MAVPFRLNLLSSIGHYKRKKESCIMRIFLSFVMTILFCVSSYAADSIVAKVNGTALTQKDLENEVNRVIQQTTFHHNVPIEKRKEYYSKALDELINRELEYQDALAKGIKPDKKKIDAQMEKLRKRFKSENEYKAALETQGLTETGLRNMVKREMVLRSMIAKTITAESVISEKQLKKYYEKNTSKFKEPERVRLRIISTTDEKKAKDILAKLKAGGDFAKLAAKSSEDSYRANGGDIGYVHKGRMLPEIEDAAFKMKVGGISGLIKAENYWCIIKVEDRKPEHQMSFDDVKVNLRKELEAKRSAELTKKWVADLRAKAKIEVFLKTK